MNTIKGTDKSEALTGTPGDDVFQPGKGGDYIDGGAGNDIVELPGKPSDYTWRVNTDGSIRAYDAGDGWTDNIRNVEFYRFSSRPNELVRWDAWYGQMIPANLPPTNAPPLPAATALDLARALVAKLGGV